MGFLNFKSMYRTEKAFLRFLSVEVAISTATVDILSSPFYFILFFYDSNDVMRHVFFYR